jgi:hypothetical protein
MILNEFDHIGPLKPDHRPGLLHTFTHLWKHHSREMAAIIELVNIGQAAFK